MVNFPSFAPNELPAKSTVMVVKKINFNGSIAVVVSHLRV